MLGSSCGRTLKACWHCVTPLVCPAPPRQAYEDLLTSNKAEDMREQQLLRMKMGLAYRTGDVEEARKIAEKLKPDDPADVAARPAAPRITIK